MKNYCMNFTNEEITWFLVDRLRIYEYFNIHLFTDNGEEINGECEKQIQCVTFDGDIFKSEFSIYFYGYHTALYFHRTAETFDFFDDAAKGWCGGEIFEDMIVYEGNLSDKIPFEILELLREFVLLLARMTNIEIERYPRERVLTKSYEVCDFVVKITNDSDEKKEVVFDNIKFIVNGHLDD